MIKVSSQALAVIRTVSAHPRLGDDSGLQITQSSTSHADLKVAAVPKPCPDADVVETVGGRLFLGPGVRRADEGPGTPRRGRRDGTQAVPAAGGVVTGARLDPVRAARRAGPHRTDQAAFRGLTATTHDRPTQQVRLSQVPRRGLV